MSNVTNLKSVEKEFELNDGEKIKLVINFALLYQLRIKRKNVYDAYSNTIIMGSKDLFDFVQILYTAYLCANINDIDNCMDYEKFVTRMPSDVIYVTQMAGELTQPKKK